MIVNGSKSIGFSIRPTENELLEPPLVLERNTEEHIDYLLAKYADLETLIERKADKGELRSLLAISDEAILLSSKDIVLVGDVTIAQIINEQNGSTSGEVDISITRIVGDLVKTGAIQSNNYGASQGTEIDLDAETVRFGGSANPKLYFDGTDLFIESTINAGVIQSNGFGASEGIQLDLDNETITAGGSSSPKLYYDGNGNLSLSGDIESGSTIDTAVTVSGTSMGTIRSNADDGADIQSQLEVSGSTILRGTIEPQNAGGIKVGSISWNTSTGALTGGDGVATTEFGIIGADGGVATFSIQASNGSSLWAGDISTAGQVIAQGTTAGVNGSGAIVAQPSSSFVNGIVAEGAGGSSAIAAYNTSNGAGIYGQCVNAIAGSFQNTSSSSASVRCRNTSSGPDLELFGSGVVDGDAFFTDDVDIEGVLTLHERSAPSSSNNEIKLFAALSADSDSTLGISMEQAVTVGTSPVPTHRFPVVINNNEYWFYVEER